MKSSLITLLPLLAVAAACGGSGAATEQLTVVEAPPSAAFKMPGNQEILNKVYDPNYHTPEGFFVDERVATTTRSYSLHHVLDSSKSYERCTDDPLTAQAWEEADNDARAVNGYYVDAVENDRYFEFVRELEYTQDVGNIGDITSPGFARVFKCSYVDRTGVDRNLLDGYSGRLAGEPVRSDRLKGLIEYLWQFRFFNVSRKAVIASFGTADTGGFGQTLLLALLVNQGTDQCDRIDVVEWQFRINNIDDEISRQFVTVRSFESELVGGIPQICS